MAENDSTSLIERNCAIEDCLNKIHSIAGLILGAGTNATGEFEQEMTWGAIWIREAADELRGLITQAQGSAA